MQHFFPLLLPEPPPISKRLVNFFCLRTGFTAQWCPLWLVHPTTTIGNWSLGKESSASCSGLPVSSEARTVRSDLLLYSLIQLLAKNVNVLQIMREECSLTCNTQSSLTHTKTDPGCQYHNSGTGFSLHFPTAQTCYRKVGRDREELGPSFCQRRRLILPSSPFNRFSAGANLLAPSLLSSGNFIAETLGPMPALALVRVNTAHPLQEVPGTSYLRMKI